MAKQHQFATKAEAEAEKHDWKHELPAVPSAYQPSGKLPQDAITWMTVGVALGIPAGALAGIAVAALGIPPSLGMLSLFADRKSPGSTLLFGLATILVVLATFLGMFIAIGLVASQLTFLAGKRAKNRSRFASVVLAIVSALLALAPFWVVMSGSPEYVDSRRSKQALSAVFGGEDFGVLYLVAGAITAAVAAGLLANGRVNTVKFCENCEQFMEARKPRPVSRAGVKQAAASLGAGKVGEAAGALSPVAAAEQEGTAELSHCSRCRAGYVEIKLTFAAQWPKPGQPGRTQKMAESWLCWSQALPPGGVDTLAKVAEKKPLEAA